MSNFRRKIGIVLATGAAAAILALPAVANSESGGSFSETTASTQIRLIDVLEITKYRGGPALVSPSNLSHVAD